MAISTRLLIAWLPPLLAAGGLAHAQQPALALARPEQQATPASATLPAPARSTSLESILQRMKIEHHAFFLYRSEIVKNKYVNVGTLKFRDWEQELTYVVTLCGLQVEKTQHNVYLISAPKTPRAALPVEPVAGLPTLTATTAEPAAPAAVTVKGRVLDVKGEPIPGVTVVVKNTSNGTTTDVGGNYTLSLPDATATLIFSSIGYVKQELDLQGRTQLDVTLQPDAKSLDEVVVTGYTVQRKSDLTGAVAQINQRDINALPVTNVSQIIQGKAAGVAITAATGAPGDPIAVRIRGIGTLNDNDPLYVIDGVPTKDGINQIAPADIESINILKDAASAAIYGARASNGVIVVTTKRGKSGKARLSVNAYTGVQTAANLIKMANTAQYVNAYNVAAANDGRDPIPAAVIPTLPDVNWLKEVLKPAAQNSVQLDVSGGNDNSQYIVSGSYLNQKGLIQNSSYERYNLRTAVSSTLSKYVRIGTNANLSYAKTRQVGSSGDGFGAGNPGASIVRYALFRTPATPVYNEQGQFVDLPKIDDKNAALYFGDGINPVALADAADRNFYTYGLIGDAYLEVTPISHLRLRSDYGVTFNITDYKQFFKTFGIDRSFNSPPQLAQSNAKQFNYNWTNTATYDRTFGRHTVSVLLGSEALHFDNQAISASRTGYADQSATFQYLDSGTGVQLNGGGESHSALLSGFGRLSYDFDGGRYLASVNFRRDGSSQLSPGKRTEDFYSGSVGWNIAQENFMRNLDFINQLKLRASVGQLGNSAIGNYPYASLIGNGGFYPLGGASTQSLTITTTGNHNIRWETSTQTDVGLDIGLLKGALQVNVDYFIKNTNNVLQYLPQPPSGGQVGSPAANAGSVRNRGLEVELNYRNTIGTNWSYNVGGNLATLRNEVTSLAGAPPIVGGRIDNNYYATLTQVGQPIGSFYLLQTDGIFQNAQEVFTSAYQGPGIQPGDVKFKDISGPDGVPDGVINGYDRSFVGSPIPKITYGLTGSVRYKSLDISLFWQGVAGNKLYNQVNTDIEGFYRAFNLTERAATNYWTGEGTNNVFPRLSWTGATNNKQPSTRFLEDGSYLRLKNVQLGYTFGPKLLAPLRIASVRLYASVQNLLTFTRYTGLDPEQGVNNNSLGDGVRAVGIDFGNYPSARTFTLGINAGF